MLSIYGFLGILQSLLLPGLASLSFLKKLDKRMRLILAVPCSILLNQYLVLLFAVLHIHTRTTWISILFLELILCVNFIRQKNSTDIKQAAEIGCREGIFLLLAFISLGKYIEAWSREFGTIFTLWDAVVSWNTWGAVWFSKPGIPIGIGLYAQALPSLYSIPYALMGSTQIQIFSKAIAGIIFLTAIIALIDLGFRNERLRNLCWLSAFIYPNIQAKFFHSHWNSGYADIPLSNFVVFTFYAINLQPAIPLALQGLLSGTAPLIKQPGLLLASIANIFTKHRDLRSLFIYAFSALIAFVPWYIVPLSRIYLTHNDKNNTYGLAMLVNHGLLGRWEWSLSLLHSFANTYYLLTLGILTLIGLCVNKRARPWVIFLGIPYFLIWGTFFSYDIRNLAMAIFPLSLGIVSAILWPIEAVHRKLLDWKLKPQYIKYFTQGFCIYAFVLLFSHTLPYLSVQKLQAKENSEEMSLGRVPDVNLAIDKLVQQKDFSGTILSSYGWVTFIPKIAPYITSISCGKQQENIDQYIKEKKPAYFLFDFVICGKVDLRAQKYTTLYSNSQILLTHLEFPNPI